MPAEGFWTVACLLQAPPPQGSISKFAPAQQLDGQQIVSTGGTVAQIRIELEDRAAGVGDTPKVNLALFPASGTFSVNTTTNVITTSAAHGRAVGDRVTFNTTGTLPAGLAAGTDYYVVNVVSSTEIEVSTTPGGTEVDITTSGSGTLNWRGYGQMTVTTEYGGGTSNVIVSEGLDGEDNDFDRIRGIHVKLSALDTTAPASGKVVVEIGDPADEFNYVRLPMTFDSTDAADSVAVIAAQEGFEFSTSYPMAIHLVETENCQLIAAIQGT